MTQDSVRDTWHRADEDDGYVTAYPVPGADPGDESDRGILCTDRSQGTGRHHDEGKPSLSQVPREALTELARVLDYGERKYTEYFPCDCHVNAESQHTPAECAAPAITGGSSKRIPNSPQSSEITRSAGKHATPRDGNSLLGDLETRIRRSNANPRSPASVESTGSPQRSTDVSSPMVAESARGQNGFASTIATPLASSAGSSVTHATSDSGLSNAPTAGSKEHASTCASRIIKRTGKHNWRGGMDWTRLLNSAARHLWAYIDGEDLDPETGLSHMAHLMANAAFLIVYRERGLGRDDRHGRV